MSLEYLKDGWMRFGEGRQWRCSSSLYLCEVDTAKNTPNYLKNTAVVAKMRRVKSFYAGRVSMGLLDEYGTALDSLTANAFAESYGTVPSPLSTSELRGVANVSPETDGAAKLEAVIRYIANHAPYLERREPHYIDPVTTPNRVSLGAHHVLISTGVALLAKGSALSPQRKEEIIEDLVCRVPAESLYAAQLAVQYFNERHSVHLNQPPLLAATYNAGSPRSDSSNEWNLHQYGNHVDRWVAYYNTSRML